MNRQTACFIRSILHGMTGAGLFGRLRYPGQAEVFVGTETEEETRSSSLYRTLAAALTTGPHHPSETEVADYYARLYRTESDEHNPDHDCVAY